MATKGMNVCCLDVGQGMCTFIEVYDDTNKLIRTLLFDLGSTKNSAVAGPATIAYIAKNIIARKGPDGYLDALFVSHKDADHVNLLTGLLEAVPKAKIGKVFYGGRYSWYQKSAGNVLTALKERCAKATDVQGFPIGDTGFVDGAFKTALWAQDGLSILLLVVNTPYGSEKKGDAESEISTSPDGDQANSKSLVCIAWLSRGDGFCISGDATFPTMAYTNTVLGTRKLLDMRMMLLPHHGSRKTTFGLPSSSAEIADEAMETIKTFGRNVGAKTLIASADTKHSHPSFETITIFRAYTDTLSAWWSDPNLSQGNHYLSTYLDLSMGDGGPDTGQYISFQNHWNVYSTLYCHPENVKDIEYPSWFGQVKTLPKPSKPSPPGMNWIYWVPMENKPVTLTGVDSGRVTSLLGPLIGEAPVLIRRPDARSLPALPQAHPPLSPSGALLSRAKTVP